MLIDTSSIASGARRSAQARLRPVRLANLRGFARFLMANPVEAKRCIHLKEPGKQSFSVATIPARSAAAAVAAKTAAKAAPAAACGQTCEACDKHDVTEAITWRDSLDREYDFILDTFPNEPGPRETMLPHNPALTKEMDVKRGDILIGRPLACPAAARSPTAAWS